MKTWNFWNAINLSQTASIIFSLFLSMSAVSEILQHRFLTIKQWWILCMVSFLISFVVLRFILMMTQQYGASTDHADGHTNPFSQFVVLSALIDAILMALTIAFYNEYDDDVMDEFDRSRWDRTVNIDHRMVSAWTSIMAIVVAGMFVKMLQLMLAWDRHAYAKYVRSAMSNHE
jgi:hypothetical protein